MNKTSVVDIEAINWTTFACLGFFDGDAYTVFWSIEGFLDHFLRKKYRGFKCWAHFGGRYDFRFFIPYLHESGKYDLKFIERSSRIMSMTVIDRKTRHTFKFCDSFFLLPASLARLGETFGIEYMKQSFDVESCKTIEDWAKPTPQKYLRYDVLGLYEILEKFASWGLNRGVLKATLPSQALYIWSTHYLKTKMQTLPPKQEEFIRKTYYGGRVEIFRMYGEDLYYYDFNSLYPTVMLEDMPCGSSITTREEHPDLIGFYKIRAWVHPDIKIPPLAYIKDGKLLFPVGEGIFYVTSAELRILREHHIVYKVIEGIVFSKKAPIFRDYIRDMYDIRLKNPPGTLDNFLAKLCMNSTYGKTGQKRENEELIFTATPENGLVPYDEDYGLYLKLKESKSKYILPYIASYVTSLARAKLYGAFNQVGHDNVWYCDTDSIITNKKLPSGKNLGELKLECKIKRAVFLQPKAYCMETEDGEFIAKIKGMKNLNLKFSDFKKALDSHSLNNIKSEYKNIMGFRETIRRNKNLKIARQTVKKQLNCFYDKRVLAKNYSTNPIKL